MKVEILFRNDFPVLGPELPGKLKWVATIDLDIEGAVPSFAAAERAWAIAQNIESSWPMDDRVMKAAAVELRSAMVGDVFVVIPDGDVSGKAYVASTVGWHRAGDLDGQYGPELCIIPQ
jgi:hypothetical protein